MHSHKLILPSLLLAAVIGVLAVNAEQDNEEGDGKIYRKYHPDGVVEFSDKPMRGGEEMEVEGVPTYQFGTPREHKPGTTPSEQSKPMAPAPTRAMPPTLKSHKLSPSPYTQLNITRPARDETIRANDGNIQVSFSLAPDLQTYNGHQLAYLLDGKLILKTAGPTTLKNLDRGTHTLVLQVVDKDNKVLIHSDSVTFHIKRYFKPKS